jgi:NADH-quinone oxidoreductase subunit N
MTTLHAILPASLLTLGVLGVVLADVLGRGRDPRVPTGIALASLAAAAIAAAVGPSDDARTFLGALRVDRFAVVFTVFCCATGFVSILAATRGEEPRRPSGEFLALVVGSVLGMSVLAASVDLVTLYLAFETVSITGYVLVGMRRADRLANEASMKYVLFGAVSSGFMLYGISILYGFAGGTSLESLAVAVRNGSTSQPAFVAAAILVFAGFAFKVSAVPFHFWAPDVYQGAPAAVGGFLAVASKAAGFAALVRVGAAMGTAAPAAEAGTAYRIANWENPMAAILAVAAVLSMTVGNVAAVRQRDVKRLLAYSSIAHAGYMLMVLAVWTQTAVQALLFYLVTYLFMNLAAFLIAGIVIRETGTSAVSGLRGLGSRHPWLALGFAVVLVSLTGLPPTFGFIGKWALFYAVLERGYGWLAVVGLLNGAISLYYYFVIVRSMYLEPTEAATPSRRLRIEPVDAALTAVLVVPVVAFFLYWGPLYSWLRTAVPAGLPS